MAHKKGVGISRNGRDSKSKRLGVKKYCGNIVKPVNILVKQRCSKFLPLKNVYMSKDYSIHSYIYGKVSFQKKVKKILISVL
ncbi:50S ribosomal protein L27 [Candidatus Karelsulcia muelleri]|uniref:Large ribosomal subunit protein bL27 n=1 Tax=Candidatus Karelsulcia muelleri TaxID=336810 RepID=A0A346E0V0_9FLAO|nr:50S ribosomal protein L27 [Candidatus Karelsulcia muelleri]AXN02605.1 LSU ribosomal protein L27p [Candidatus Karelsulcia muelleri]WDR79002.1 50S ribosomal protein L27 [Candidatus Karelsulcia muelleri]